MGEGGRDAALLCEPESEKTCEWLNGDRVAREGLEKY